MARRAERKRQGTLMSSKDRNPRCSNKIISNFVTETGSEVGSELLKDWNSSKKRLSLVMPRDYARVLAAMEKAEREGLPSEKVIMEVING